MAKKIILFGGSFDPVHCGHVRVAKFAAKMLCADQVVFIPAKRSPHKSEGPGATGQQRLTMIDLAIADIESFTTSDCELQREEPSYTLDTVKHFRKKFGSDTVLYWLIGADTITDLHRWYGVDELIDICNLCVMHRGGFQEPDFSIAAKHFTPERLLKLESNVISTPLIDVSSTNIRQCVRSGQDISNMVGQAVARYIAENMLYLQ